jgi:glutamate-1-semialdehyde 2,1-aminomutase
MTNETRAVWLEENVRRAEAIYEQHCSESRRRWEAARQFLPGGNTRSVLFYDPFPLTFLRGEGARLWDADNNEYTDFLNEYAAGLYGHSDPTIRAALESALEDGVALGGLNQYEASLAEAVQHRFPSCALVRFCNSASEANLMALSLARIATGRSEVMVFDGSYHGGMLAFPKRDNPINAPYVYRYGTFNDLAQTLEVIRDRPEELAAIMIEPMIAGGGGIPADRTFLQGLRDEATRQGIVLIFDEAMTSRMSPGGLQGFHGIVPDMSTFGKYFGGGLASGAFGGRRDIMELLDNSRPNAVMHAGTFNNNVLAMAAGFAGLSQVFTPEAAEAMHKRGDALRNRLAKAGEAVGVPLQATGVGSLMAVHFQSEPVRRPADLRTPEGMRKLVHLALFRRGFQIARRGYITLSLPVTDADCERFGDAFESVLTEIKPYFELSEAAAHG